MIVRELTQDDIDKKVIYGIDRREVHEKKYGVIVRFDNEFVYVRFNGCKKIEKCEREDLDFDWVPTDQR